MKVRSSYGWVHNPVVSLHQAIEQELAGSDPDRGVIETVEETADNCVTFLARLATRLVDDGVLRLEDLGFPLEEVDEEDKE